LLALALSVLVLEIILIFIPATLEIRTVISNLVQSESKAKRYAEEISSLYNALKKSHKDLADINYALDQASVFAKADKNGKIVYVSNKFTELTGFSHQELKTHITTLDRKSTRLNSSHVKISYAVFCLKKKKNKYKI